MEILSSFGIHWSTFIAQIINFGILVFVLSKLVYKPLIKSLEDRERVIKKLAEDSGKAEQVALESSEKQKEILDEARKQAQKIIKETEVQAKTLGTRLADEAKKDAEKIILDGQRKIQEEQEKFNASLRAELVSLVAIGIEKTVGKYITKDANEKLSHEALEASLHASKLKVK